MVHSSLYHVHVHVHAPFTCIHVMGTYMYMYIHVCLSHSTVYIGIAHEVPLQYGIWLVKHHIVLCFQNVTLRIWLLNIIYQLGSCTENTYCMYAQYHAACTCMCIDIQYQGNTTSSCLECIQYTMQDQCSFHWSSYRRHVYRGMSW